ncbi:ribosome recycling factor [Buchnera aphidicola]|uniref:ribosome recycling factor n=1 Tax=Buchnera aphidicola TaxID=9 RepID=UPI0034639B3A
MIDSFKNDIDIRMMRCLEIFKSKIHKIRTGRISPSILDGLHIEYYEKKTLLNQLANIIMETSNTLKISVFDHSVVNLIEKAILNSHLEVNPIVVGNNIKIIFPPLTEERRKKLFKIVRSEAEAVRICIRNVRRDANDFLKKNIKKKIISKDIEYFLQNEVQILTDSYIRKIDHLLLQKESEIMKF